MFSSFPLLRTLVTPNRSITFQPTLEVLRNLNEKSGEVKPHIHLLEQIKGFVACCLELVPLRDMGFKQATSSITFLSGRKGAWEAYFTQLIVHQHHRSVWINWILSWGLDRQR